MQTGYLVCTVGHATPRERLKDHSGELRCRQMLPTGQLVNLDEGSPLFTVLFFQSFVEFEMFLSKIFGRKTK